MDNARIARFFVRFFSKKFTMLMLFNLICLMSCTDYLNSDARKDNQHWLALLDKNEIKKIKLVGVESLEKYNKIHEINISDKHILQKLSVFIKDRKLIYRDYRYMKGQLLTCDVILFDESGSEYRLLLSKNIYSKGLVESFRNDSIYQDNEFVYFADSLFRAKIH